MAIFDVETTGRDVIQALGSHAAGKTILITGPSKDGLGAEIVKVLASANPSQLLLAGRIEVKVASVIKDIKIAYSTVNIVYIQCDLIDNSLVRQAAAYVNSLVEKVDILINNAGIMAARNFHKSADGLVAAQGVVVNMTSSAYTLDAVDTQDPNFEEGKVYNPWNAYGRAKTANVLFSIAVADRFGSKGVVSFAVDPGMVAGTNLMANSGVDGDLMQQGMEMAVARNGGNPLPPHPKVNLQQGCASAVLVSLDSSLKEKSPAYVKECAIIPTLPYASDKGIADKLWKLSEKLVGQTFDV